MTTTHKVSAGQRHQMIAEAAYFRAERRGFDGGDPVTDWIEAETEVDAQTRRIDCEHTIERLEAGLATAANQLAAFKTKVAAVAAEARGQWQNDVEKLTALRDKLRSELDELRHQGADAGQKAKQRAEKLWDEIAEVVERIGVRARRSEKNERKRA